MWTARPEQIKEAAEAKFGKGNVKKYFLTSGLYANVELNDGTLDTLYSREL